MYQYLDEKLPVVTCNQNQYHLRRVDRNIGPAVLEVVSHRATNCPYFEHMEDDM